MSYPFKCQVLVFVHRREVAFGKLNRQQGQACAKKVHEINRLLSNVVCQYHPACEHNLVVHFVHNRVAQTLIVCCCCHMQALLSVVLKTSKFQTDCLYLSGLRPVEMN